MKILVTGTAGFIGFHLTRALLDRGDEVVGIDNINDYYDPELKYARLKETGIERPFEWHEPVVSGNYPRYTFIRMDITDRLQLEKLFAGHAFDRVIHLAAQAGVRYSLENPRAYLDSNIAGFLNILECSRHARIPHLTYASSSSVYGLNETMPFSVHDNVDHPISLYAASKKANELMAHTYSHLFGLPTTGLRFFTVYGPWGRPDMALFKFTRAILADEAIDIYNHGKMKRDFTYVDDIVQGVIKVSDRPASPNPDWEGTAPDSGSSPAPWRIYNIGNSSPVMLLDFIHAIEISLGKEARKNLMPLQPGDVPATCADVADLESEFGYSPETRIEVGIKRFAKWYFHYHNLENVE